MKNLHEERAVEKQADRDADQADVEAGVRSAEQVNRENTLVHVLLDKFVMRKGFGLKR
jgi:hypothetical protein